MSDQPTASDSEHAPIADGGRVPIVDGHNDTVLRCTDDDRRAEMSASTTNDADDAEDGEGTPGADEAIPGADEAIPGADEAIPGADEAIPGADEAIPGVDEAFLERDGGHLDLPRALEAGFAAGLFATYVPTAADPDHDPEAVDLWGGELPPAVDPDVAKGVVYDQFAALHRWAGKSDQFRIVTEVEALDACIDGVGSIAEEGGEGQKEVEIVGAIPHIEGAAAIEPDLSNLDLLYAAGLRSVGLVWSRPNQFAHGVPFIHDASPDTGPGLTDAGRDLVRACNDRGIVIDCAHLNEAGFRDVLDTSADPPVVSHACAHDVCPATRNLTNEQLAAIGERDGLVGLSFGTAFLHPEGKDDPSLEPDVMVDHLDVFVEHAGVDSVALGSDFDGASIPDTIGDVGGVQVLLDALRERGYDETEIEKIAYGNWRRVLADTWSA